MKHIVVTAADEAYEGLLFDLIASLLPHVDGLNMAIGCLDIGLSATARDRLSKLPVAVVTPKWPFGPNALFDSDPKYLSRATRPFLPDLFPGYETCIWMDADCWVQQPAGLQWLLVASAYSQLVVIPTIHRTYTFRERDMAWLMTRYEMAFGRQTALKLMQQPYLNSGVFAAPSKSPFWTAFANRFGKALENWTGEFLSDQAVMNAVAQLDGLNLERLPSQANWISHLSVPVWDPARQLFCAPSMPFEPVMILHNTFNNKLGLRQVKSLANKTITTQLTFSAFQRLQTAERRLSA